MIQRDKQGDTELERREKKREKSDEAELIKSLISKAINS